MYRPRLGPINARLNKGGNRKSAPWSFGAVAVLGMG